MQRLFHQLAKDVPGRGIIIGLGEAQAPTDGS